MDGEQKGNTDSSLSQIGGKDQGAAYVGQGEDVQWESRYKQTTKMCGKFKSY